MFDQDLVGRAGFLGSAKLDGSQYLSAPVPTHRPLLLGFSKIGNSLEGAEGPITVESAAFGCGLVVVFDFERSWYLLGFALAAAAAADSRELHLTLFGW